MSRRQRVVVAADPGYSGGVAAIRDGEVVLLERMPTRTLGDPRRRDTIDQASFDELVGRACGGRFELVSWWTEDCWGMPRDGTRSFGFGGAYHAMAGCLLRLGVDDLHYVVPATWQKALLREPAVTTPRPKSGSSREAMRAWNKAAAIEYCQGRWPGVSLVPKGCRVEQSGLADALCIASYGWDELFGGGAVPVARKTCNRKTRGMRS